MRSVATMAIAAVLAAVGSGCASPSDPVHFEAVVWPEVVPVQFETATDVGECMGFRAVPGWVVSAGHCAAGNAGQLVWRWTIEGTTSLPSSALVFHPDFGGTSRLTGTDLVALPSPVVEGRTIEPSPPASSSALLLLLPEQAVGLQPSDDCEAGPAVGFVCIETDVGGRIEFGWSGAPVVDPSSGIVVGVVVRGALDGAGWGYMQHWGRSEIEWLGSVASEANP